MDQQNNFLSSLQQLRLEQLNNNGGSVHDRLRQFMQMHGHNHMNQMNHMFQSQQQLPQQVKQLAKQTYICKRNHIIVYDRRNKPTICNICIKDTNQAFICKECDESQCIDCYQGPSGQKRLLVVERKCQGNHKLKPFAESSPGSLTCDICRSKVSASAGCRKCNFDMCGQCCIADFEKQAQKGQKSNCCVDQEVQTDIQIENVTMQSYLEKSMKQLQAMMCEDKSKEAMHELLETLKRSDQEKSSLQNELHEMRVNISKKEEQLNQNKQQAETKIQALTKEIQELNCQLDGRPENLLCKICYDRKCEFVLVPCGHLICSDIRCLKTTAGICPFDRKPVESRQKIYLN